jgi:hypothetical protein
MKERRKHSRDKQAIDGVGADAGDAHFAVCKVAIKIPAK